MKLCCSIEQTPLRNMCKSIIGMANINAHEFQNIRIKIPPITLQNYYAGLVETVKKNLRIYIKPANKVGYYSTPLPNALSEETCNI
jgi:type I restriction enzyme S subunit